MIIPLNNQFIKNYSIEYGCEAAWAGYYDGIDAIPGALIKYACIDTCYHQLCEVGCFYDFEYPSAIKKHALLHSAARVLAPIFIKRCLGTIIDRILNRFTECDQEEDQLIEMGQSLTQTDFH